jgi:hypothetical protein
MPVPFGGGVIGNTAGSGPVVGGSSPPPRAGISEQSRRSQACGLALRSPAEGHWSRNGRKGRTTDQLGWDDRLEVGQADCWGSRSLDTPARPSSRYGGRWPPESAGGIGERARRRGDPGPPDDTADDPVLSRDGPGAGHLSDEDRGSGPVADGRVDGASCARGRGMVTVWPPCARW